MQRKVGAGFGTGEQMMDECPVCGQRAIWDPAEGCLACTRELREKLGLKDEDKRAKPKRRRSC